MAERSRRRSGGQLNRSETVTVRLDPKLNYLCELAARSQRRTKSSLIEAALAEALNIVVIDPRPSEAPRPTIAQMAEVLWHVNEAERLDRLVRYAPHLMTYEEQTLWSTICDLPDLWFGEWRPLDDECEYYFYDRSPENLWTRRVQERWDDIQRIAMGDTEVTGLPRNPKLRKKKGTPLNALLANATPESSQEPGE